MFSCFKSKQSTFFHEGCAPCPYDVFTPRERFIEGQQETPVLTQHIQYSKDDYICIYLPKKRRTRELLGHTLDKLIDHFLTVTPVSTTGLIVSVALAFEPLTRGAQLEGPQEVVRLLEVRATGVDLMDDVFNTMDAVFP